MMAAEDVRASADEIYAELADKKVVNVGVMSALFGGNSKLTRDALAMFVQVAQPTAAKMTSALAAGNFDEFHRSVHQLKGSAGYIGAERVQALALTLQTESAELKKAAAAAREGGAEPPVTPHGVAARAQALLRCLNELFAELEVIQAAA